MKNAFRSMLIAISMYSKIPTPYVEWSKEAMQYSFCFFPIVGIFIGALQMGWWYLADFLQVGSFFYGAVTAVLPLLVTGGIHMDGYMDTMDAKHSYQPKERRLEILKDPHIGAFAVITALIYMVLYVGAATEITNVTMCALISIGFILSRAYSSMAFVWFEPAKKEGTFYQFASSANKKAILISETIVIIACGVLLIWLQPFIGIVIWASAFITFLYYKWMSYRNFGGVTGDLAGYFLQICELVILLLVVILSKVIG